MLRFAVIGAVVGAFLIGGAERPASAQEPPPPRDPGVSTVCGEFEIPLQIFFKDIVGFNRPDEGWAYVDPARKRRQATGVAHNVRMAAEDTPANHNSHDVDFELRLDSGQEDLLSIQLDSIAVEWESGIGVFETTGDGANPIFPKWAWPSSGDRVWVDGNWIHDCGHPDGGLLKTEIHPARAIATMREHAAPLPGTGLTPVPVTLTNLFISGNGGYVPNQLNCGPDIILGPYGETCGQATPPADDSYKTTPINDTDFSFNVCLPARPSTNAVLIRRTDPGPGNTVSLEPDVEPVAVGAHCAGDPGYDQGTMLRVTVPLKGTSTPPTAVYARRIYAGWLVPPDPVLPHRRVSITSTDLHEDHELDPGDGELSFWFANVDAAQASWLRLSDFANGNMDDYDDDTGPGDGEMSYTNASFDFYLRQGNSFSVYTMGYEQDCFDNEFSIPYFGDHRLYIDMYIYCYQQIDNLGAGDAIGRAKRTFTAQDLGPFTIKDTDEYDVRVSIEDVPTTDEDTSHLSVETACTPDGEVALAGQPLTCLTRAHNSGTGLPRRAQITNGFSGPATATVKSATWSIPAPLGNGTYPCSAAGSEVICEPDTIPVTIGIPVTVAMRVTPTAPGVLTGRAEVTTASTDPDLTNNVATTTIEVFRSVTVDVSPRNTTNEVNLTRGGAVAVAILTTDDFNATTVDPASVCFGDAEAPAQRTCTEQHRTGHLEDVNGDRRLDLLLHFDVGSTGIDFGDTSACLLARTRDGVGLYGCNAIVTQ